MQMESQENGRASPISTRIEYRCDSNARNTFKTIKKPENTNLRNSQNGQDKKLDGLQEITGVKVRIPAGELNFYSVYLPPEEDLHVKQLEGVPKLKKVS